jgi:multiple sugar transport system substrate-binding protein
MKKIARNLIIFSGIICISFFAYIISCTKNQQNSVQISFWAMGIEGESIQKLLPEFHRTHPQIRVKVQMFPWTAAQEKLITAFASDNLPDAFQLGNTWIPQFVSLGALEKLDKWVEQSKIIDTDRYFDGIWQTNLIEGILYGIPWYIDTRVLFYRTDILQKSGFDSMPKSWDDLYLASQKLNEIQNNDDKYAIYLPTNEWATFVIFGLQTGSQLLKENNKYGNFSDEKFKSAFEFLIRFHKEKLAPLGLSSVTNIYQAFSDGYISMYISGPWNIPEFKKWMTGDLKEKWMTAPLPGSNGTYPGVSLAGGSSLVINRNSEKKVEVWKFIEFLSQPDIQIKFYKLVSDLPAVKEAWNYRELKNDPYMRAFFIQFHHVVATPKIPEWEQIAFSKIQQYAEYAARGVMSSEQALRLLDNDVNKILEKRRWLLNKESK